MPLPPYAEEIGESRIGLSTGLAGVQNATRTFRVYTAKASDNPIATIESISRHVGGERVGNVFPARSRQGNSSEGNFWGDETYVLHTWTILDHWIGTNVWILLATYVPSYITGISRTLWAFRISSSIESSKEFVEIPWENDAGVLIKGRGIGPPHYIKREERVPYIVTAPGLPDRTVYVVNQADKFTAAQPDPTIAAASIQLPDGSGYYSNPSLLRYMVGADVPVRTSILTLTKRTASWNLYAVQLAMNALGKCNRDGVWANTIAQDEPILFAESPENQFLGPMLFTGFEYEPIVNDEFAQPYPSFQVTLTFAYNPRGWQKTIQHTYKWPESGMESPVFLNGFPVEETFHVVEPTELGQVVSMF